VDAEASCLALAKAIHLTTVDASIEQVGKYRLIVVSRYDRNENGSRTHQEDLLQALGIDSSSSGGRVKYQVAAGPPSHWHLVDLIKRFGKYEDQFRMFAYIVFNVVIGNGDAHAKNYSFFLADDGSIRLAPLYDTVPTALWPELKDRNALTIGDQRVLSRTTPRDLLLEASRWGMSPPEADLMITSTLDRIETEIAVCQHEAVENLIRKNIDRTSDVLHLCTNKTNASGIVRGVGALTSSGSLNWPTVAS
jgi:serine/threonine-protein kinase HipA